MDRIFDINDTRLFVDERGPADGQPLLFIHGGPGNPSWDFMASVGDLLAEQGVRVIGVDQRGVLRSDDLPAEPPLSVDLLIRDFEQLREALGIERWTIIGHSSGGAYALDYALRHPERISGLILDCPALDTDATDRHRLPRAAAMLDEAGDADAAAECRRLAGLERRLTGEDRTWEAMLPLGDRYLDLFFHDAQTRARYDEVMNAAPEGLDWGKGMAHLALIGEMYTDRRPALPSLQVPSTLIHGEDDLVAPPVVVDAYRQLTGGQVATVADAGHFAFVEQPAAYVHEVMRFVDRL
ncbi:alpha/beta hydrolase [Microbacterium sp. ARD32]|uniref:alpha/beta fold hydrolase n=1 Tax=Microbacterium sp. ARD32 TaxID=2962577 RepID=UPI002881D5B1|nr:alpha/beta hydrolase [Microbacterium sp. ARD32]MDT0156705.1 alpha/beta hydrolase [Microbacterium sp. ARD32]